MNISSLELCCASDSELAAAVVEHSVVIRVTSSEDLQPTRTRPALHRLLMIYKVHDVVVVIWVSIPCTAGTPFKRINEKLGAVTGDLAMTYKLVVAAVVLRRCAVRIGDGFSWEWSKSNELWDLVVLRNPFARCGSSSCLVSTTAVGQQFVDREGSESYYDVVCVKATRRASVVTWRRLLFTPCTTAQIHLPRNAGFHLRWCHATKKFTSMGHSNRVIPCSNLMLNRGDSVQFVHVVHMWVAQRACRRRVA